MCFKGGWYEGREGGREGTEIKLPLCKTISLELNQLLFRAVSFEVGVPMNPVHPDVALSL